MPAKKQNDSSLSYASKCIESILDAFDTKGALIVIYNNDEYFGRIVGNEDKIAQSILIGMEHDNVIRKKNKKNK